MKKIFKYMLTALAALSLSSCLSLLDQEPLDSFTDEAVWGDLSLAEVYLNAQYSCNGLRGENSKNVRYACFVDELFHKHGYGTANTPRPSLISGIMRKAGAPGTHSMAIFPG